MELNKRYLMYETNTKSGYMDYGQVNAIINDNLVNINIGGEKDQSGNLVILEAVSIESNYIPKIGDWVGIEWRNGQPIAIGSNGGMHTGLSNINDNVKIISTSDITNNVINAQHIRTNSIEAYHISANAITSIAISASTITGDKIVAGTISGNLITASTISGNLIASNQISANHISVNSITGDKIVANTISGNLIAANTISGNLIAANTISGNLIASNQISANHISVNSITGDKIVANTISGNRIAANTISGNLIAANQISANHISVASITGDKIVAGTISGNLIAANTISGNSILANTISGNQIAANQISANHIAASQISATHISANTIDASKMVVGTITAASGIIATAAITNALISSGTITSAKIGNAEIKTVNIASGNITTALIADASITNAKINDLNASKINAGFISAGLISAGTISGYMINANQISGSHIMANQIDTIQLKAGAITAVKIAAQTITGDKISAETITGDKIMANSITAEHITTKGLDANLVTVYNPITGQVLIGGGFLRVDGMDVGVVQSDNLAANGLFLVASSQYGNKRMNPSGEALLGSNAYIVGGSQLWKINAINGTFIDKIDITGKKPVDIAIDENGTFAYITVDGDSSVVQLDLANFMLTSDKLDVGMGPQKIKWVGNELSDHKHLFMLNTDPMDMNIPDSLMVIDAPPNSINGDLYVHHQILLGNTPYDFILDQDENNSHILYVTQAGQGDIAIISMASSTSMDWKVVGAIPISAYGTDNYHGGVDGKVGLGTALGGDASSLYSGDSGMSSMSGMHNHGGYGASDGSMKKYTPHGIALSSDSDTLYVADYENDELVVISKSGSAPYNSLTGRHDISGNASPMQSAIDGQLGGGGPTTAWVRYRISVGQSPDAIKIVNGKIFISLEGSGELAVINEQDIIDAIVADRAYYATWNNTMPMNPYPNITVRKISVGSKPGNMVTSISGSLYVSIVGQNQVAVVNTTTEIVTTRINTGPNPKGLAISADGNTLYVVNNGGTGELSFVYPKGPFIGDAFLGLEGMVEYQGGEYWTPDRSDWVKDVSGNVTSASTVEFRINEPFLNEGGYAKLTAQGKQYQYAQIEQDIYNVTNYSNGNSVLDTVSEILIANSGNSIFYPKSPEGWLSVPAPHNIKIVSNVSGNKVYVTPSANQYSIYYGGSQSRIEFSGGVVPSGNWVEADYRTKNNLYFKPHNGSVLIAIENSSSPNFNTVFEVDEFVPKFVTLDNQQTSPFTPTGNGISQQYNGLWYSVGTNRAIGMTVTGSATPVSGNYALVVNGIEVDELEGDTTLLSIPPSSGGVVLPSGNQWVKIDLGSTYMIGSVSVAHSYGLDRIYHNTKTEVSEDGITWATIYDSAVSGEYSEKPTYHSLHGHTHYAKFINFDAKPVRYVRDWANGWISGDGLSSGNTTSWTEIKTYGDWEVEKGYTYLANSSKAGQQLATNGNCMVSTDIQDAYVSIDIPIEFTSFWYMSYAVGPQLGTLQVDMVSMGMVHTLFQDSPYINKVAHRHIMALPPSVNIEADSAKGIKAGMHRTVIRQLSGKITLDRFRFEDFQYYTRSSTSIPNQSSTSFTRYKIVAEQSKWYLGSGNQSTFGAYDEQRINPDSLLPDYSVPIKYRIRVRSELNANGTVDERGISYVTSSIFETGKLSTHWRRSEAQDRFPGSRIEEWDGNQPHKTGIQSHHIANGAVRGTKILPAAIMDYHISPYAKISESKLKLSYPTHNHTNKAFLDSMTGFAGSGGSFGTGNAVARSTHDHDSRYLLAGSGGSLGSLNVTGNIVASGTLVVSGNTTLSTLTVNSTSNFTGASVFSSTIFVTGNTTLKGAVVAQGGLTVTGNIIVTGTVDGVDISVLNTSVTNHIGSGGAAHALAISGGANGFIDGTNYGKLLRVQDNAINQATADGRYLQLTSGGTVTGATTFSTGQLAIDKISSHLLFKESGVSKWHIESVSGVLKFVETGFATRLLLNTGNAGTMTWNGNTVWHSGNFVPANYYLKTETYSTSEIDTKITSAGNIKAENANVFTNAGLAVKIQPSANIAVSTKVFQVANTTGVELVSINYGGDMVVKGNLTVSGTTQYAGTTSILGDYGISGNLVVSGNTILGDATTDQTTINGTLILASGGVLKQMGQEVEVMRFPVYGIGGDLQFQTDNTIYENIIDHYYTFDTAGNSCLSSIPSGATRKYRLLIAYADDVATIASTINIVQQGTSTSIASFTLPNVSGANNGTVRTWLSSAFTTIFSMHTTFQAKRNSAGGSLVIKYIEIIAYDVY